NIFNVTIIPPNLGDYDTVTLLKICSCLNGSMCSQACFYILPGANPFILRSEEEAGQQQRQKRREQTVGEECESENANDPWRVIPRYNDLSIPSRAAHGYGGWQGHHGV